MLGRSSYTQEELETGRAAVAAQLAAFRALTSPPPEFERRYFTDLVLMLDRLYVHRVRGVTGKDPNPLNEVEVICASLIAGQAALQELKPIRWKATDTVLGLEVGDPIALGADDYERLATAFLDEIEERCVTP